MSDFTVRVLTDDDWDLYRTFRLASLAESPDAFAASHDEEQEFGEDVWRERMLRATRLLAEAEGKAVGVASVRRLEDNGGEDHELAEFFGMWVDPDRRGKGIGVKLMRAAVGIARSMGSDELVYWVSTDNGPGVAFASSYGFRTTDARRLMKDAQDDEDEMLMVLPLADTPNPSSADLDD